MKLERESVGEWVIQDYYKMSKEQLKEIAFALYCVACDRLSEEDTEEFNKLVYQELEERGFFDD